MQFFNNYFITTQSLAPSISNTEGELNPLLQTNLMVIHPPIVFLFYSLCLATSSIVMAGMIRDDGAKIIHSNQIFWARASFTVGTIGIGLGGLWAYTVLDWEDIGLGIPVETGSLLPWIALLIIIHARSNPNSKSAFSISPALALITGALTLHSTLVTRANGVWASVHAFVGDGKGTLPQDPYLRILEVIDFFCSWNRNSFIPSFNCYSFNFHSIIFVKKSKKENSNQT